MDNHPMVELTARSLDALTGRAGMDILDRQTVANTDLSVWNGNADVYEASDAFSGSRPGWCFKLGIYGLGYYVDLYGMEPSARLTTLRLAYLGLFDKITHVSASDWHTKFGDGTTLLHLAVRKGKEDLQRLALAERNLDVDVEGHQRRTPLMWAAGFGQFSSLRLLLDAKADPKKQDEDGATPLMLTVKYGQPSEMLLLLALSCERNTELAQVDLKGMSAVHWAAFKGNLEALKLLNRFRADLQQVDMHRNTALHWAVQADGSEDGQALIVFLIEQGVDPAQENAQGQTLMDVARNSSNKHVLPAVEKALAGVLQRKRKKNDVLDLEKGSQKSSSEKWQEKLSLYLPVMAWIGSVSFTVFEYILDTRQLAWQVVPPAAFAFECGVLISLLLFIFVAKGDPGIVASDLQTGPESLLGALREGREIPANRLCTTSWILKDLRTKYCKQTEACVQEFDHFCDFTCCAIGKRNHRQFVILLVVEPATQCWYLLCSAVVVYHTQGRPATMWDAPMWAFHNSLQYPLMVLTAMVHLASLVFLGYLLATQVFCIATNITMNELSNWERYTHLWITKESKLFQNPFNKGFGGLDSVFKNAVDFWWLRMRSEVGPESQDHVRELVSALRDAGAK